MKPIIAGVLASITALGLLLACGSDSKSTVPASATAPAGVTLPGDLTIPDITFGAGAIPSDVSIPQQAIDQMVAQMEAAGMKVDKACFSALLKDDSLRKLVAAGGSLTPEAIQKFLSCVTP